MSRGEKKKKEREIRDRIENREQRRQNKLVYKFQGYPL